MELRKNHNHAHTELHVSPFSCLLNHRFNDSLLLCGRNLLLVFSELCAGITTGRSGCGGLAETTAGPRWDQSHRRKHRRSGWAWENPDEEDGKNVWKSDEQKLLVLLAQGFSNERIPLTQLYKNLTSLMFYILWNPPHDSSLKSSSCELPASPDLQLWDLTPPLSEALGLTKRR